MGSLFGDDTKSTSVDARKGVSEEAQLGESGAALAKDSGIALGAGNNVAAKDDGISLGGVGAKNTLGSDLSGGSGIQNAGGLSQGGSFNTNLAGSVSLAGGKNEGTISIVSEAGAVEVANRLADIADKAISTDRTTPAAGEIADKPQETVGADSRTGKAVVGGLLLLFLLGLAWAMRKKVSTK